MLNLLRYKKLSTAMNGTRLGRGRGGRLALYGGCLVVLVLLVFLYRAATTEMTRLHELNVQCTHQEEALAAQLQVIFEYKVRLEKSLSEEKTSNLALKHELQERATREKTLRDKDIVEATQRYNSLQQQHKILQSEHQDLRDECDKRQKQSLIETGRLEATLQDLRSQMRKARDDKDKSMEHLKNKYLEVKIEKEQLENKYNDLLKSNGNTDSTIEHLNKQVFQLKRELEDTKMNCKSTLSGMNMINPRLASQSIAQPSVEKSESPSLQQQVSQASNNVDGNPPPIRAPPNHQLINESPDDNNNQDEKDRVNNIGFIQRNNEVVEPAGASDIEAENEMRKNVPPPFDIKRGPLKNHKDTMRFIGNEDENVANEIGSDQRKIVLAKPYDNKDNYDKEKSLLKRDNGFIPILINDGDDKLNNPDEKQRNIESPLDKN
ncbi:hypothetical protein PV325_007734 [Microctonus aethiopoides]|nr:hypothetical protein PV325_007734 [Microctonus aethiopoides]